MKIGLTSVLVDDQEKALQFYTGVLGFVKVLDFPMGPEARWLTVASPEGVAGVQLLLEPMGHPAAGVYQKALFDAGIPATSFFSDDIQAECARLKAAGVVFHMEPTPPETPGGANAIFADGCGNLINLHQT